MGALAASALDGVKPLAKVLEVTADHRGHGLALGLVDDPVDQAVDVLRVAHLAAVDGRTRGTKHVGRRFEEATAGRCRVRPVLGLDEVALSRAALSFGRASGTRSPMVASTSLRTTSNAVSTAAPKRSSW